MGRGRAKAKQTKVARQLKYSTHQTDLERLQQELAGGNGSSSQSDQWTDEDPYAEDEWKRA
ncbi:MAG: DUF3073 domain-containing protein [Gordonia sp. (in: high G+C Gram-positive bacteria)]|uniref:DUF3073 domain-containing protein n=1 Tax=Gordonia sp. (in: high G+C Gram-positive bacteria) TaxID=84139 RepID=UPI0039E6D37B